MKNCVFLIVIILFLGCNSQTAPQQQEDGFPQAVITNGLITAKLYLPDAEKGYYLGSRFDWSGVIPELTCFGHDYFGQWFPVYDPKIHDAISGPVEEYMQIGYDEAPVGGEFLRIGIGGLRKDGNPFERYGYYEFSNPGKWTVQTAPDNVVFTHELNDVAGYSYVYQKTVRLVKDRPEMVLEHTLKNTGQKAIQTSTYNHNFLTMDRQPTGPDITVKFAFPVIVTREDPLINLNGQIVEYIRELAPTETASLGGVQGFSNSVKDYDFRVENQKTGAGVRITGDKPILRIVYWSCGLAVSPEPYIDLNIQPGESFSWNIYYNFYSFGTPPTAAR